MVRRYLLISTLFFSCTAHAKVLLWDLGGVLFEPNKLGVALEIGLGGFLSHSFWDMRSPTAIQTVLFDVLEQMMPPDPNLSRIAGSATGVLLPTIMCHWQAGTITGKEIIKRSHKLINKLYKYDYFDSETQAKLVSQCIHKMFDPEVLARNIDPALPGIRMLEECKRLKNEDGTYKHRNFAFSNWDHLSFDIFRNRHRRIFGLFEHIVISGHIKLIKPHRSAYDYLIKTYNLDPKDCILIDDQEMNARAARLCGMKAVLIRDCDYVQLRKELKRLGVL